MKVILTTFIAAFIMTATSQTNNQNSINEMIEKIHWIQQAAVKIETDQIKIYIDPFQITDTDNADIVLITHSHSDHLSPDDIAKVANNNTLFIATADCEYNGTVKEKKSLLPGQSFNYNDNIKIEAVPAYNIDKTQYHPKENNWVGYIITINGIRIYHTGDTERIPEMQDIECDIILLPLGQTYTMNSVEDAVQAVIDTKAKIAIPIHYGLYEGKKEDAQKFAGLLKDKTTVIIKECENQ